MLAQHQEPWRLRCFQIQRLKTYAWNMLSQSNESFAPLNSLSAKFSRETLRGGADSDPPPPPEKFKVGLETYLFPTNMWMKSSTLISMAIGPGSASRKYPLILIPFKFYQYLSSSTIAFQDVHAHLGADLSWWFTATEDFTRKTSLGKNRSSLWTRLLKGLARCPKRKWGYW